MCTTKVVDYLSPIKVAAVRDIVGVTTMLLGISGGRPASVWGLGVRDVSMGMNTLVPKRFHPDVEIFVVQRNRPAHRPSGDYSIAEKSVES